MNYFFKDSPGGFKTAAKQYTEMDEKISPSASLNKLIDESAATKARIQQLLQKLILIAARNLQGMWRI